MIGKVTLVVITELAKNRRDVAAATMVLRSVGVSPSRNCDLRPRDTAAIRDAGRAGLRQWKWASAQDCPVLAKLIEWEKLRNCQY